MTIQKSRFQRSRSGFIKVVLLSTSVLTLIATVFVVKSKEFSPNPDILAAEPTVSPNTAFKLPAIFRDHMVLQRGRPIHLWGVGPAGNKVTAGMAGKNKQIIIGSSNTWDMLLDAPAGYGPYVLTVIGGPTKIVFSDVLVGDVWLCSGQSNMGIPLSSVLSQEELNAISAPPNPNIRVWRTESQAGSLTQTSPYIDISLLKKGWSVPSSVTVPNMPAVCYIAGRKLADELHVPIGLIMSIQGSSSAESWMGSVFLKTYPPAKVLLDKIAGLDISNIPAPLQACTVQSTITANFNTKIYPLAKFTLKGVMWYQGESNQWRGEEYKTLLPLLMQNWRAYWQEPASGLPFYIVGLPRFNTLVDISHLGWAEVRDSQYKTTLLPNFNAYFVPTSDTGDLANIHPLDKKIVAERLAQQILSKSYGIGDFVIPHYSDVEVLSDSIHVAFSDIGAGLNTSDPNNIPGFELAGDDGIYSSASAKLIDSTTVEVKSDSVISPKTVRYDWKDASIGSLLSSSNLPIVPFRTDEQLSPTSGKTLSQVPLCQF